MIYEFPVNIILPKILTNYFVKKKKNIYYVCSCATEIKVTCNDKITNVKFESAKSHVITTCPLAESPSDENAEMIVFFLKICPTKKMPFGDLKNLKMMCRSIKFTKCMVKRFFYRFVPGHCSVPYWFYSLVLKLTTWPIEDEKKLTHLLQ